VVRPEEQQYSGLEAHFVYELTSANIPPVLQLRANATGERHHAGSSRVAETNCEVCVRTLLRAWPRGMPGVWVYVWEAGHQGKVMGRFVVRNHFCQPRLRGGREMN